MMPPGTRYDHRIRPVEWQGATSYNYGGPPTSAGRLPPVERRPQEEQSGYPSISNPFARTGGCEEECAQDECLDAEQCGADNRPPQPEHLLCKCIDTRPLLPVALSISTIVGGIIMLLLQVPLVSRLTGVSQTAASFLFSCLYLVTLGCMCYCTFADPGQMRSSQVKAAAARLSPFSDGEAPLPLRAYRSWQYKRPIRRYDHYCRWVTNCIGLLNHREFLVMLVGIMLIAALGMAVDMVLAVSILTKGFWNAELLIVLHLGYSIALMSFALPIFRIHIGLVLRNETAAEWKRYEYYVVTGESRHGMNVPVNELSDDEFNALTDVFVYERSRNSFDNGWMANCSTFWCHPRWSKGELGEF